jgi:hypothetical protein
MIDATIDLHRYTEVQPRTDPRIRTGMLMMAGVGVDVAVIAAIVAASGLDVHALAVRVLVDAIVLLTLVAYITLSTRSAVAQLRQQIVGDVVTQVSAVVATRIVNLLHEELAARGAAVEALTREVARQRGQLNAGLRDLADVVQRVETYLKTDIETVYDLGAQSARD